MRPRALLMLLSGIVAMAVLGAGVAVAVGNLGHPDVVARALFTTML